MIAALAERAGIVRTLERLNASTIGAADAPLARRSLIRWGEEASSWSWRVGDRGGVCCGGARGVGFGH